jgi:cytochrome d ubiquinol oxidase subunit II
VADIGYGLAHAPYILYPQVPTAAAFSNEAMFCALLWVVLVGRGLLVPAFLWLWRLFVLDPRYTRR